MKKVFVFLLIILSLGICHTAMAQDAPKIYADCEEVFFDDDSGIPFVSEEMRTMVPVRKALEAIGTEVEWNPNDNTIHLKRENKALILTLDSKEIITKDGKTILSEVAPFVKDNRIYLPIRIVAEELGATVLWNEQLNTVFLLTDNYKDFKDMFSYEGELSKYADVATVVVTATYKGTMNETKFEEYWMSFEDSQAEAYLKAIATDKKALNPEYEILINFFYSNRKSNTKKPYLGSVSSYSFEARRYNPFDEIKINPLN